MRRILGAAAGLAVVAAVAALAQTTPPGPPPPTVPVPSVSGATVPGTVLIPGVADLTPIPSKAMVGVPLAGANSFTESQARSRIEAQGFTNVNGLRKDDGSIWRGRAMKDGKTVSVALDYQGNVIAN